MKKTILAASAGLLALVLAGTGYWYLSVARAFQPRPVPLALVAAEDALAVPGLLGLMHFDAGYAIRVERAYYGAEDENPLPVALTGEHAYLQMLRSSGLDAREMLDQVLGGVIVDGEDAGFVAVLLGRFPVAGITELLEREFLVTHDLAGSHAILQVAREDKDTCSAKLPASVHITETRIVLATDPLMLRRILDRLEMAPAPERDLDNWRAFRDGKLASTAFLAPPLEAADAVENPWIDLLTKAMEEHLSPIRNSYAGVRLSALPPAIELEGRIDTSDPTWPIDVIAKVEGWRSDLVRNAGTDIPSAVRLHDRLRLRSEEGSLHLALNLNREVAEDFGQTIRELIGAAFSNFGVQQNPLTTPARDQERKEEIIPPDEIPLLVADLGHDELRPFDGELYSGKTWQAESGPFGLRVTALRLNEKDPNVVEIELDVASGEVPSIVSNTVSGNDKDPRAKIFVTRVLGHDGRNLLRAEPCGKERNELGAELRHNKRHRRIDNEFKPVRVLTGKKTLRLTPGVALADIASLEGHVRFVLPTGIETRRLSTPLAGEIVEWPDLRIRFREAEERAIAYDVSGQSDRLLEVRALNRAGDYLASAGMSGGFRLFGAAGTVTKKFKGKPSQAELVVAHGEVVEDYAFSISDLGPRFPERNLAKPSAWAEIFLDTFADLMERAVFGEGCEDGQADGVVGPFRLCPKTFQKWGDGFWGRLEVSAPNEDMLKRHLSALEIIIESVSVRGTGNAEARVVRTDPENSPIFVSGLRGRKQSVLQTWESARMNFEDPDQVGDEAIIAIQGRLRVRVPEQLGTMTLDVTSLGNSITDRRGAEARLTGYEMSSSGTLVLEYTGPRERLVELVARDAEGGVLGTGSPQVESTDDPGTWRLSVAVSGQPAMLDLILAEDQHRKDYPFDLPIAE